MVVIDLLPPDDARAAAAARRLRLLGRAAGLLVAAGAAAGHFALAHATASTRDDAAAVAVELRALRRPVAELRRLRRRQTRLAQRLAVIQRLEGEGRESAGLLGVLADTLPRGAWLTELVLADGRLRLEGAAVDDAVIADFVARLRAVAPLTGVDLEEAAQAEGAGGAGLATARRFVVAGRVGGAP